jgi:sulfur-oxidizing protein SoxY
MTTRRALLALTVLPAAAAPAAAETLREAMLDAVGDVPITDGGITLRVPTTAENGGQVPITILAESPMTAADHVTAIHVFATRNPTPGVASFRLTPLLARAEVQTRIRLAEDQRVIVLAQSNDGRVRRAVAVVRVTTGGCLT